jgi:predicted DNA-binding transcriptional regulator AlpA
VNPKEILEADPLLKTSDVVRLLGLGRTTIYELIASGALPQPIRIGPRAVRHSSSAILAYRERGYQRSAK